VIALIVIAGIVLYVVGGFVTYGYIHYSQVVYPERWKDSDTEEIALFFGSILWPLAWLLFIPMFAAARVADRIAERGKETRKLAEANEREIKRAMRELE